jgi:hypothetical protein
LKKELSRLILPRSKVNTSQPSTSRRSPSGPVPVNLHSEHPRSAATKVVGDALHVLPVSAHVRASYATGLSTVDPEAHVRP